MVSEQTQARSWYNLFMLIYSVVLVVDVEYKEEEVEVGLRVGGGVECLLCELLIT